MYLCRYLSTDTGTLCILTEREKKDILHLCISHKYVIIQIHRRIGENERSCRI